MVAPTVHRRGEAVDHLHLPLFYGCVNNSSSLLTCCVLHEHFLRFIGASKAEAFLLARPCRSSRLWGYLVGPMSVLAATRRAITAPQAPRLVGRRFLGDSVRGPLSLDLTANAKYATEFFTKGAISYAEYKQQCVSLRLFAFTGVTGACALGLMLDPPKSSYWQRYSPLFLFSNLKGIFASSAPPVFLTAKVEHEADVPDIAKQLITTRRIASAGSDSEEE